MIPYQLNRTLNELEIPAFIRQAEETTLIQAIALESSEMVVQHHASRLPRLGYVYETQGFVAFSQKSIETRDFDGDRRDGNLVEENFNNAFRCWRALISLGSDGGVTNGDVSSEGLRLIEHELGDEILPPDLNLAFRVAVSGMSSGRIPETRLELRKFRLSKAAENASWKEKVSVGVFRAITFLVRKDGGWDDIQEALTSIVDLQRLQAEYEDRYLDEFDNEEKQTSAAVELVALYHLAKLTTLVGDYLREGQSPITRLRIQLDRHHEQASTAFSAAKAPLSVHLADLVWVVCRQLVDNAIWSHIQTAGEAVSDFARLLAQRPDNPVLELWPSQQNALRHGLLDTYPRAILVEMPTSAGKTLLAKFLIVQAKALNPSATIVYLAPTRALVNQITRELRNDFRGLRDSVIHVEQAVPAFELDPMEDRLLKMKPDILVTTPEKLDLLIRGEHSATENISLVIADEAHNIADETRGARLELLLGMLKRERSRARFLLLSPFMPNREELLSWLGEERALPPIQLNWQPSQRIIGAALVEGFRREGNIVFETLPASSNLNVRPGIRIPIVNQPVKSTKRAITKAVTEAWLTQGSVLVLCKGAVTAVELAKELTEQLDVITPIPELDAICHFLDSEAGEPTILSHVLRYGVAYHHAGMSLEARWLVEELISKGVVRVICGTSTLAQGMNFPIKTVIMETLRAGSEPFSFNAFWNIAGRAGRALKDIVGIIVFPVADRKGLDSTKGFLKSEATAVVSQLAKLIVDADIITNEYDFSIAAIRRWPQLSALLQFLAHAMRVSNTGDIAEEVEDLLRASLIYHQARSQDPAIAQKLIELCRTYLQKIKDDTGLRGVLKLADTTGFATPTVLRLLAAKSQYASEFTDVTRWNPERLFSDNLTPMQQRIEVLSELPEIELGQGNVPPFNAHTVAAILRDWVLGENLSNLADKYYTQTDDPEKKLVEFSRYLFSHLLTRASWGIGALQTVSLSRIGDEIPGDAGYVPSMLYFGVKEKEAVWLRAAGVPRLVADGLARKWRESKQEPQSYDDIRDWVSDLRDEDWRQVIPKNSKLTSTDMRIIWEWLGGGAQNPSSKESRLSH